MLIVLTLLLIVPSGPMLYRLAFQPLQNASVLILLIVAVAVEFVLMGFGLYFFGAEGARTPVFSNASLALGGMTISAQSLIVLGTSVMFAAIFYAIFEHTMIGKALRAIAFNRVGARLVGISPTLAGKIVFAATAAAGALSGILIGPISTIFYDTGFLIGLKGFVAALFGGLPSTRSLRSGRSSSVCSKSFSSFWASAFKEVIVFTCHPPAPGPQPVDAGPAGGRGMSAARLGRAALLLFIATAPFLVPHFWITVLNYIGLAASSRSGWCCSPASAGSPRSARRLSSASAPTRLPT